MAVLLKLRTVYRCEQMVANKALVQALQTRAVRNSLPQ
jgi:hypothetical protein